MMCMLHEYYLSIYSFNTDLKWTLVKMSPICLRWWSLLWFAGHCPRETHFRTRQTISSCACLSDCVPEIAFDASRRNFLCHRLLARTGICATSVTQSPIRQKMSLGCLTLFAQARRVNTRSQRYRSHTITSHSRGRSFLEQFRFVPFAGRP